MKRKRGKSPVKRRSRPCSKAHLDDAYLLLKEKGWDISTEPDLSSDESKLELCTGEMKLLLPIVHITEGTRVVVYYRESIKRKKITVANVLLRIYKFYNEKIVKPEDVNYLSVPPDENRDFAVKTQERYNGDLKAFKSQVRFIHFLQGQTTYNGLHHKGKNIYMLETV